MLFRLPPADEASRPTRKSSSPKEPLKARKKQEKVVSSEVNSMGIPYFESASSQQRTVIDSELKPTSHELDGRRVCAGDRTYQAIDPVCLLAKVNSFHGLWGSSGEKDSPQNGR
jgi:hypothetical protein